jgi:hypothetical protein
MDSRNTTVLFVEILLVEKIVFFKKIVKKVFCVYVLLLVYFEKQLN